jgi:hypothetical protein
MKFIKVLIIIFFTLLYPNIAKSDNIRDFEIEEMSIGDSLLNFFTEKQLKLNPDKNTYIYPKSDKYILWVADNKNFKKYDGIQIHYKKNDSKYIVESVDAHIYFFDNIKDCYPKKKEIYNDLTKLFPDISVNNQNIIHSLNKDSKVDQSSWTFNNGDILFLECYDWSPEMPYGDKLSLSITSRSFNKWLTNEAY